MRELPESVMDEACRREWKMVRGNKIEIESKDEMRTRVNISPDLMDALVTAVEGARRLGFVIDKLSSANEPKQDSTWRAILADRGRRLRESHSLTYA
jgi:hypothetical protein